MKIQDFQDNVTCGGFDNIFANIYKPQDIESQKSRYMSAVEKFTALYPNRNDIHVFSAPGRTEIGGNHTDHQHGCVIAGAVDLDVIGVAAFHNENIIRIKSDGYDEFAVSLDDLDVHIGEKGSSEIVRGIAACFKDLGVEISEFDMYTTSSVLGGSGISSSAAFETLIATAIDLCVDICKCNGIKKLNYTGNKSGNLTMHKWYWATACPGPYLSGKFPYIASEVNKRLSGTSQTDKPASAELYRVRRSWSNASSQIGAYRTLDNAKKACKSGYSVFDSIGKAVYTKKSAKAYTKGTEVKLSNVMLYVSATAKSGRVISGTYYIYDNMVNKGRMRITNKKTNCGRSPVGQYVTGWVNKSDI